MKSYLLLLSLFVTSQVFGQSKSEQLDSVFSAAAAKGGFNGNVLVAEKGVVVFQKSYGMADRAKSQLLNAASVFELASVSKQFTAMGIMLLKKQGKLRYEDSLRHFFPSLPYHNITIKHLLQHTSGLPDYMELFMQYWDSTRIATNKDLIDLMVTYHPDTLFAPGAKWEYSNTGYALLGSIIEKVSGKSFGDFLDKNIFQPLQMKRSSVFRRRFEKRKIDNYAFGYVRKKDGTPVLPDSLPGIGAMVFSLDGIVGDGTVNSTTNDLLKWDRAWETEKLVSKTMIDEAFSKAVLNNGSTANYGFGWAIGDIPGVGKLVNHTGGWPGYATFIEKELDNDKTIIVLTNQEPVLPYTKAVRNILNGIIVAAPTSISVDSTQLAAYRGEYELMPGFTLTVFTEGTSLFVQATGQSKAEIFPEKEDQFYLKIVEAKLKFIRDEKKSVKSVILYQNDQELEGKKIR